MDQHKNSVKKDKNNLDLKEIIQKIKLWFFYKNHIMTSVSNINFGFTFVLFTILEIQKIAIISLSKYNIMINDCP
jgi:hypothetical protein